MLILFLHIGQEISILVKDIVAIIDLETKDNSPSTKEFLTVAEDEGFIISLTEKPNSFIVTTDKVFLSPISAMTLKKRVNEFLKGKLA